MLSGHHRPHRDGTRRGRRTQDEVTGEWDRLAGDWDDLAAGASSASTSSSSSLANSNPNAELFLRQVRPLLLQKLAGEVVDGDSGEERKIPRTEGGAAAVVEGGVAATAAAASSAAAAASNDDGGGGGGGGEGERSSSSTKKVRIVDFGCGTGIMIEHILRWWRQGLQKQQQADFELEVLAIDASPQMVEILRDKVQSREWWDGAVTPLCCVLAQVPSLPEAPPSSEKEAKEEDDPHTDRTTSHHEAHGKGLLRLLRSWAGTADLAVSCCALEYVPDDDLQATVRQLAAILRPDGQGRLIHCERAAAAAAAPAEADEEDPVGGEEADDTCSGPEQPSSTRPEIEGWRGVSPAAQGMTVRRAREIHSFGGLESIMVGVERGLMFGAARTHPRRPMIAAAAAPPPASARRESQEEEEAAAAAAREE